MNPSNGIEAELLQRLVEVLERLEQRLAAPQVALGASRRLATAQEAMDLLGVRRSKLFALVRAKKVIRVLEGMQARFDVASIERYLEEVAPTRVRRGPRRQRRSLDEEVEAIRALRIE